MADHSGFSHGTKYWVCAKSSVGVSINKFATNAPNIVNIYGFSDELAIDQGVLIAETPQISSTGNYEIIFDIEHGILYLDDVVVYTVDPANNIYKRFCIELSGDY